MVKVGAMTELKKLAVSELCRATGGQSGGYLCLSVLLDNYSQEMKRELHALILIRFFGLASIAG